MHAKSAPGNALMYAGIPSSIGRPPTHAPMALPKLKATWPRAAARSCPSPAPFKIKICSGPEMKKDAARGNDGCGKHCQRKVGSRHHDNKREAEHCLPGKRKFRVRKVL